LANFATSGVEESWQKSWLVEGSGMFWSSWGEEGSLGMVRGNGFDVLEGRVVWEDERLVGGTTVRVGFLWVLGRKGGTNADREVVNDGEAKQGNENGAECQLGE